MPIYRSGRDYAGWLKIVIPALSVLDDLVYGSARMISDFPIISYRGHGDVLTKSAVKGTNPRNESYGGAAGNLAVSGGFTFTTPDTTQLVISNVAATDITSTRARITWATNDFATGHVEYGLTTAYGQWSEYTTFPDTGHWVDLTGLTPGTTYHFRVWSSGFESGSAVSGDFTFTTAPDTTPPTVTSFSPAAGATNVNVNANVTVIFSEAMNPATVNGSTVELRDPSNALVPATVSYNAASFTATLDPTASLSPGITYTARVRGGGQGKRIINSGITGVEVENFQQISLIQSRQEPFGFNASFERLLLL